MCAAMDVGLEDGGGSGDDDMVDFMMMNCRLWDIFFFLSVLFDDFVCKPNNLIIFSLARL